MDIKKVRITSHWVIDGKDQIGEIRKADTKWLDSIKVSYEVVSEDKGK